MESILIIGAGGLGKEAADLIRDIGGYEIIGFLDDNKEKKGAMFNSVRVLDTIDHIDQYKTVDNLAIAIASPAIKKRIYEYTGSMGFCYPNLVHPTVIMGSGVRMGMGNIVCAYSILSTEVVLRDFVTINPQCGIGHESELQSFTTAYWSVHIGGNTSIHEGCELGSQSCVIQGLKIAGNVVLGAGAVAVKDISENGAYIGIPAKRLK